MKILLYILLFSFLSLNSFSQKTNRITPAEYIKTYKDIAIEEMHRSGIPASITLAQGMLESENGNSSLAKEGKNHFGIKCHDWTGGKIYRDDDEKNECFRKYKSEYESFKDHTDFLKGRSRYSFLFEYSSTDYKNWAQGLKKAGYATNPSYSQLLIKLIEGNKLYAYDQELLLINLLFSTRKNIPANLLYRMIILLFALASHEIFYRNRIQYIVVKDGDTFGKLADELELMRWELPKYNDLPANPELKAGDILYIQPKRNRASRGHDMHVVKEGETMRDISQLYGVKLSRLYKFNCMDESSKLKVGDEINLRKSRKCN
ncbi:MAG: LysM peptidoglycan-binding domain-containing protein [Bacteroidales bacterium]|nr:LysM peptidoglycan-binding domain-containing protein [Bacteroidales bacterium]